MGDATASLPPGAASFVQTLRAAALSGKAVNLGHLLAPQIDCGGEEPDWSRKRVLRSWMRQPRVLQEIISAIDKGCLYSKSEGEVVCPPDYFSDEFFEGYRVCISEIDGKWRVVAVVAGD